MRPPLPKTSFIWDVQIMFECFRNLGDNSQISDKHLSQKLLILPLFLGGQRLNSELHFTIHRMIISSTSVTFSSEYVLNHSKPGRKLDVFKYRAYPDPSLCVLECLKNTFVEEMTDLINCRRDYLSLIESHTIQIQ